jgi:hypothetical protein
VNDQRVRDRVGDFFRGRVAHTALKRLTAPATIGAVRAIARPSVGLLAQASAHSHSEKRKRQNVAEEVELMRVSSYSRS